MIIGGVDVSKVSISKDEPSLLSAYQIVCATFIETKAKSS